MLEYMPDEAAFEQIRQILRPNQTVMICVPHKAVEGRLVDLVGRCGAFCVVCGDDLRWKMLLRMAFSHRIQTVIGDPRLILGFAKLSRASGIPLKIRNAVLLGPPCGKALQTVIEHSLDCRIMSIVCPADDRDQTFVDLEEQILAWTSILDCKLRRGECGLEMNIITFAGEQLPKLPSCARLLLRPWEPEEDIPFCLSAF